MAKQQYVLSTLTNSVTYCEYGPHIPGAARQVLRRVTLNGGAGLTNKNLLTPRGVSTPVTDEEVTFLKSNGAFKRHHDRGWVSILNSDPRDADKAAADQAEGDKSKQLTETELKGGTKVKKS